MNTDRWIVLSLHGRHLEQPYRLTEINLNVRLDKTSSAISSPFNVNLIENFKLTGSIIFYRVVLMVDDIDIHQITGANIRDVGFS